MILRIQKEQPDALTIKESHLFIDTSNNTWKVTVALHDIYIEYLGNINYRLDKFVLVSNGGRELSVTHNNLFSIEGSSFEDYFEIRDVILSDNTENIWKYLQWRIYNSPIGAFS